MPFVCTLYMNLIIRSILARAQAKFDVIVCAAVFLANHFHMLIVVQDPEEVVRFLDSVKTELAHAVNHLLGKRRHTIWCDDYDAEPILTLTSALNKFAYLYTNPQAAGLVDTIDEYSGVSTWQMFLKGEREIKAPWVQRFFVPELNRKSVTVREDIALCQSLREKAETENVFKVDHFAWLKCFGCSAEDEVQYKNEIIAKVRTAEAELRKSRKAPCVGVERLRSQPINLPYTPKKFGRKMWCICDDVELRKMFIAWVKSLRTKARETYARWKMGDRTAEYPPGMFPPSFPKLANLVPGSIPSLYF